MNISVVSGASSTTSAWHHCTILHQRCTIAQPAALQYASTNHAPPRPAQTYVNATITATTVTGRQCQQKYLSGPAQGVNNRRQGGQETTQRVQWTIQKEER